MAQFALSLSRKVEWKIPPLRKATIMSIELIKFGSNTIDYKLAILIKQKAMKKALLYDNYLKPLIDRGFQENEIVAISLAENEQGKTPVSLIKEHLTQVFKISETLNITHFLVCDASYFKVICKLRKAEPYYGYVLPGVYAQCRAALSINYTQLFFNPSIKSKLVMGIEAISRDINGKDALFKDAIFGDVRFPKSTSGIKRELKELLNCKELTCDIETNGLHLRNSGLVSIAFGRNQHDGVAFMTFKPDHFIVLTDFFNNYKGKLIFHNATFDIGRLIYQLYQGGGRDDIVGMLYGLHLLYRDIEDTQILAYLGTNSTAGNTLSLKDLAFEYTGKYALDEIANIMGCEDEEVLNYNLTDALATWHVYNKYRPIVREEQEQTYQEIFKPSLKVITQMELCGIPLDLKQVHKTKDELDDIALSHKLAIKRNPIIEEFESKLRLWRALDANKKLKKLRKTAEDFEDYHFNPNSNKHLRELLYEHLELPILKTTDTGLPSTDGKTLSALIAHLEKEYEL
jgi:DNA polymerase-1